MKKILVSLLAFASGSAMAGFPFYDCQSFENQTGLLIESQQATPYSINAIVTIQGKKYHALKHQTVGMYDDIQTRIYCLNTEKVEQCSYATVGQLFIELDIQVDKDLLLEVRSEGLNLKVVCDDGSVKY